MTPDDLVEVHHIQQLKHRYLRHLDLKEWEPLAECFTPDATATYGSVPRLDGRDAILTFLRDAMSSTSMLTSHKAHQPEIELVGADRATGIWALDDRVIVLDAAVEISGAAVYRDEYVRSEGHWRISHTGYRRIYEEMRRRPDDARITASWWDAG